MNKRNFCVGMGMGLLMGCISAAAMHRKKQPCVKTVVGKTLRTLGEVADSVSDIMGW